MSLQLLPTTFASPSQGASDQGKHRSSGASSSSSLQAESGHSDGNQSLFLPMETDSFNLTWKKKSCGLEERGRDSCGCPSGACVSAVSEGNMVCRRRIEGVWEKRRRKATISRHCTLVYFNGSMPLYTKMMWELFHVYIHSNQRCLTWSHVTRIFSITWSSGLYRGSVQFWLS